MEGRLGMLNIRNVKEQDLSDIVIIEQLCFPQEEAATKEAFEMRIEVIPDSFFVAEENGVIIGFVNGPVIKTPFITDDLFKDLKENPETGGHQSILGIAVTPHFQTRGVAASLLSHIEKAAKEKNRETITLTCKEELISFYQNHGYRNLGISDSQHAGVTWYNMVKTL